MEEIELRLAEERDVPQLAEIDEICFALPWSQESFHQEICENPRAIYVVACRGDRILAYAGVWVILDEGHITNVAVRPEDRGNGLGEAVVCRLLQSGEKSGINSFTLEVRVSNLPAKKLYEKMGFVSAGIRKGYYADNGEDAEIMWRNKEE